MAIEWTKILTEVDVIDEDDMASNLDTKVPTQQSVKAYVETERTFEAENGSEQIQYPIPTSAYMLKAGTDGSPAKATNTDTEVADAVTKKHTQNTDTGTSAASFKINTGGNEADIQTTGLSADRDYTLPDVDTMLAGSALTAQNSMEIIEYTAA